MEDALDFIGWYNHKSHEQLGLSKWNARELYLAYHEGRGGFSRRTYKKKPNLLRVADKVARTASRYGAQLQECEARFRCRKFYQFWPFCSWSNRSFSGLLLDSALSGIIFTRWK